MDTNTTPQDREALALSALWHIVLEMNAWDDEEAGGLGGTGVPDDEVVAAEDMDLDTVLSLVTEFIADKPSLINEIRAWATGA
jgi:hypothetical protein